MDRNVTIKGMARPVPSGSVPARESMIILAITLLRFALLNDLNARRLKKYLLVQF